MQTYVLCIDLNSHSLEGKYLDNVQVVEPDTEKILEDASEYAARYVQSKVSSRPAREMAVVMCMDARLRAYSILGIKEGDAHVIRNAGGVVTEDVVRSLVVSQRLLGTRHIILVHHTDCGMTTFTDDGMKAEIQAETGLKPSFSLESFSDPEDNVRQSMLRIKTNPFIPHKDSISGFVFDVESGKLSVVEP
jgi:carbonic anhydrase